MSEEKKEKKKAPEGLVKFLIFILMLTGFIVLGQMYSFDIEYFRNFFAQYSNVKAGIVFVALYAGLTTVMWVGPKDILRISSALIFGGTTSGLFVWAGEAINAITLFYMSRILGQEYVANKFKVKKEKLRRGIRGPSSLSVFALKLNILFPLRIIDLSYGLSKISFSKFYIASLIGSFPRIMIGQMLIAAIGEVAMKNQALYDAVFGGKGDLLSAGKEAADLLISYFIEHSILIAATLGYVGAVVVVSIFALVAKWVNVTHKKSDDPFEVNYSGRNSIE